MVAPHQGNQQVLYIVVDPDLDKTPFFPRITHNSLYFGTLKLKNVAAQILLLRPIHLVTALTDHLISATLAWIWIDWIKKRTLTFFLHKTLYFPKNKQ